MGEASFMNSASSSRMITDTGDAGGLELESTDGAMAVGGEMSSQSMWLMIVSDS